WKAASDNSLPFTDTVATLSGDGPGFACTPGQLNVSFNDPRKEVTDPSGCNGVLAIGGYCTSGSGVCGTGLQEVIAFGLVMNNGWGPCSLWDKTNMTEVLTHEMGHNLGFAHSSDATHESNPVLSDATMYWLAHFDGRGDNTAGNPILHQYDLDAIHFLYGG